MSQKNLVCDSERHRSGSVEKVTYSCNSNNVVHRTILNSTVAPNRGPMDPLGGYGTLNREPRDLGRNNTYFGHECKRKFWKISQRNFWKKYLWLEMKSFFFWSSSFSNVLAPISEILRTLVNSGKNTFKFGLQSVWSCAASFLAAQGATGVERL